MKAVHIFTHTDDDGKFSGALMYDYFKKYRDDVEKYFIHQINYDDILNIDVHEDDIITFTDYSFSNRKNLDYFYNLIKSGHEVIWIDHHKTSEDITMTDEFDEICSSYDNFTYVVDVAYCATLLTYHYLCVMILRERNLCGAGYDIEIPKIIKYINSYDTWAMDMPETEAFIYGLNSTNYNVKNAFKCILSKDTDIFMDYDKIRKLEKKFINSMIDNGSIIKNYIDNRNKMLQKAAGFEFIIYDYTNNQRLFGFAMNTCGNSSAFGNYFNEYDVVCPFYKMGSGTWKYSLFTSSDDVDCCDLATAFGTIDKLGGGGHVKAAGFITNDCIFDHSHEFIITRKIFGKKYKVTPLIL